jgi:hypothetical protein
MDAAQLKSKLEPLLHAEPESFRIRVHRAISWLARAEAAKDDPDVRFVLLWIAFNAAYAREFGHEQSERDQVRAFFEKLLAIDGGKRIHALLFQRYSGPIRTLVDNRYLFEPFWRAVRDHDSSGRWELAFNDAKKAAMFAATGNDTLKLVSIVMDRLYVLRNQLVHGGATYASKVNRQQVADGVALLADIVPLIIDLMLDGPHVDFGAIDYPLIRASP